MLQLLRPLRSLHPWQIAVLAALLLGAGGTAVGVYLSTSDGETALEEGQQIVPVSRGDLVNDVSLTGNLVYPKRETLRFGTEAGREGAFIVGRVMVSEGQAVPEGAALVALDAETVAELEADLVKALRVLRDAEEALESGEAGATDLQLVQAGSELADAELAVQAARTALDGMTGDHASAVTRARAAVADAEANVARARLDLQAARTDLAGMTDDHAEALAKAESVAADAEVAWLAARERLDDLSLPTEELQADAANDVASAQRTLANARNNLALAEDRERDQVGDAQEARDDAEDAYGELFESWLGIVLDADEMRVSPDELIAGWDIDLDRIFDASQRYYDIGRFLSTEGRPQDDPATVWDEARVYAWLNFYPGTIVAYCGDDAPYLGVCIYQDLEAAWDALIDAESALANVLADASNAIESASQAVSRAEGELEVAERVIRRLQGDQLDADIRQAQAALEAAATARDAAESDLLALGGAPDPLEVAAKTAVLRQAEAVLESAIAARDVAGSELAALGDAPDPLEVAAKAERLRLSEARRDNTKDELEGLRQATDPLDIAILQADVEAAAAAREAAETALRAAVITAPIAGVITSLNVEPGDTVTASEAVLEIVDPTVVAMDGHVDEIDVLFLQPGAAAVVTMDALGGQAVQGIVDEIGTRPASQQFAQGGTGLVTYPVSILLSLPEGQSLPEGLTAVASVVLQMDAGVLLVPLDSVYGSFQEPEVRVMKEDGSIENRAVVLGNSDDFWVAVTSGLAEGERVVMEAGEDLQGGFFGFPGGRGLSIRSFQPLREQTY